GDRGPLGQALDVLADVFPHLAAVARDVDKPVVAAGPDHAGLLRRLGHGENGVVDFHPGVVARDGAAGPLLLRLVVARQVGADRLPGLAAVGTAEEHVGGVVDGVPVVRRDGDRRRPLEAVAQVFGAVAGGVGRVDADVAGLARAVVV